MLCHIKSKAKHTTGVSEVQSFVCAQALRLKRVIMGGRSPFQIHVDQLSSNWNCVCQAHKIGNNKEKQLLSFTLSCEQWHTELCE